MFSRFNGKPLFYTLYCVIYDLLFGLKNSSYKEKISVGPSYYPKTRNALQNLEAILEESINKKHGVADNIRQFIENYTRHTSDLQVRKKRHGFLLNFILSYLK